MLKKFRRILCLATTLVMLISMVSVPQVSASETADDVLLFADFEETKGGLYAQFKSGNTTFRGGADRVYTGDVNYGKSYRVYAKGYGSNKSSKEQVYLKLDNMVNTGVLQISFDMKTDNAEAMFLHAGADNQVDNKGAAVSDTAYTLIHWADYNSTLLFKDGAASAPATLGPASISAGVWTRVDMLIDFDTDTMNCYANGTQCVANKPIAENLKNGIKTLVFKILSRTYNKSADPASLYIDNLKVSKVGTEKTLEAESTIVGMDGKTVTINLSDTVPEMPTLTSDNVIVKMRGSDAPQTVANVTTSKGSVSVVMAETLAAGKEYEIKIDGTFTGLDGAVANGITGYVYTTPDGVSKFSEDFDDKASELSTYNSTGNINYSTPTTSYNDFVGRDGVYVATTNSETAGEAENFVAWMALPANTTTVNKKYVISYSQMINSNPAAAFPMYGFGVSDREVLKVNPWGNYEQLVPNHANNTMHGYLNLLATGGGTGSTADGSDHFVSYGSSDTEEERVRDDMVNSNVVKRTGLAKNIRLNNGEWYDIDMVVDMQNDTVDYYYDGVYIGQQNNTNDGLSFTRYNTKKDGGAVTELIDMGKQPITTIAFAAKLATTTGANVPSKGEYMLDNIKIEEFDGGKFDKQLESIRFVDKQGNKAFSTATVSTLYNKIELTGKNVASQADFGAVTLTAGGSNVTFTPSYANGVYTINLPDYLIGNTTYTLTALGETYTFTTDAGVFEVESIELYELAGDPETETVLTNISDVVVGDKVRAKVKFINTTGEMQSAWLPIAYYNGKLLKGVRFNNAAGTSATDTEFEGTVDITVDSITDLKISGFAWDGKDTMKPLIKNIILE